jgi:molybdopterin-containing oxidoreductase family iron-sulfur binding subunit
MAAPLVWTMLLPLVAGLFVDARWPRVARAFWPALALLANAALGGLGRTVSFVEPVPFAPDGALPLAELPQALRAGDVGALVFAGTNPVYALPELGELAGRAQSSFCLAHVENETARACGSVLPEAHYLESWGDARAGDGTLSFVQPLIEPLRPSVSVLELVAGLALGFPVPAHEFVRDTERARLGLGPAGADIGFDFEAEWERNVQRGFVEHSAFAAVNPTLGAERALPLLEAALSAPSPGSGFELALAPSPTLYDGRFCENAWLLELPHPLTKQSWGNAALVSSRTAALLGRKTGDIVELVLGSRRLDAPLVVLPGHADGAVTLELGFGHVSADQLSHGVGVNALALGVPFGGAARIDVRATAKRAELALTEDHFTLVDDAVAKELTLADYRRHPPEFEQDLSTQPSLLPGFEYTGTQWAMSIDLSLCSGCNACVVACQAENNTPVVGKDLVRNSREMYWLRIDRYLAGNPDSPHVIQQPMLCQHCEKAPCEYVCPVNATVHSTDGLNEMVYNRCIGTRFCSNNCPYKVRRFNWFDFSESRGATLLQKNPDVTVRERGVMEKCTYCVQRIRRAEIAARREERRLRPGEVVTACQQTCPTGAIAFGSLDDTSSEMVRRRREPRAFAAFAELGTRPRTRYLAKIRNLADEEAGS